MSGVSRRVLDRWRAAWRSVLLAAATAAATWEIAALLLGHDRPTFAAITAVVCLSPGLASRGRQALGLLVGVAVGVAVGAALHALGTGTLTGVFASTLLSMLAAASFDINPVQIIQAGASALLVIATGAPLGLARLEDAAVGGLVALLLSQVLLTPDPARRVEAASRRVTALARASVEALACGNRDAAGAQAHDLVLAASDLADAVDSVSGMRRWTLRGRLRPERVEEACRTARPAAELAAAVMSLTLWARRHSVEPLSADLAQLAEGMERGADPAHLGDLADRLSHLMWREHPGPERA